MIRASSQVVVMTTEELTELINAAAKKAAEETARRISTSRPAQVNQTQAAEMIGCSRGKVSAMIKFGKLKLTESGMISVADIDAVTRTAA